MSKEPGAQPQYSILCCFLSQYQKSKSSNTTCFPSNHPNTCSFNPFPAHRHHFSASIPSTSVFKSLLPKTVASGCSVAPLAGIAFTVVSPVKKICVHQMSSGYRSNVSLTNPRSAALSVHRSLRRPDERSILRSWGRRGVMPTPPAMKG
jgi:hypothetical protein